MTKDEFWILDAVKISGDTIEMLSPENCESAFNKESHLMSIPQIEHTLIKLFDARLIKARYLSESKTELLETLNAHEIKEALSGNLKIYYFLTEKGGRAWEEYAKPDWDLYIDEFFDSDNSTVRITSANEELISELLHIEYCFPSVNSCILLETVIWETITSWQATYWKQLPFGKRVSFKLIDSNIRAHLSDREIALRDKEFFEWNRKKNCWYNRMLM